jgi:hypothetical protein
MKGLAPDWRSHVRGRPGYNYAIGICEGEITLSLRGNVLNLGDADWLYSELIRSALKGSDADYLEHIWDEAGGLEGFRKVTIKRALAGIVFVTELDRHLRHVGPKDFAVWISGADARQLVDDLDHLFCEVCEERAAA